MKTFRSIEWPKIIGGAIVLVAMLGLSMSLGQEPEVKDAARATGYKPLSIEKLKAFHVQSLAKHGGRIAMMAKNLALPAAFDCRVQVPLPIWDQGNCGSCYLDSEVRTFNCAGIFIGLGKADNSFILAVQFGMDRPRNFGGCNGGNGTEVIDWAVNNGWVAETYIDAQGVVHNDYPRYEARTGSDRTKAGAKKDWVKGWEWGFVNANGKMMRDAKGIYHLAAPPVDQVKAALYKFGRLNIAIDAGGGFNASGTITSLGNGIDHEINMAAYDDNHDNGNGTKGAFLLENQWGEGWFGIGAGPGCKWCSYVAAQHIVDHHFISAGPLPPPPPPPDPVPPIPPGPGPDPGPEVLLTINNMLKPGTYKIVSQSSEVVPVGTGAKLKEITEKIAELQKLLEGRKEESPETKEPPKIDPPKTEPKTPKKIEPIPEQAFVPSTSAEWNAALRSAKDAMKPFVVGVGINPPAGDWYTASANPFDGHVAPSILIAFPRGGDLEWSQEVLGAPEEAAIRSLLPRKKFNPDTQPRRDPKTGNIVKN